MLQNNIFLAILCLTIITSYQFSNFNANFLNTFALSHNAQSSLTVESNIGDTASFGTRMVRVRDIDMSYTMIGNGKPLLLIGSIATPMDFWEPELIKKLSSNHTVIMFDNRGIGNTTSGIQKFSIRQFANDTAGLLDALKLKKVDVMGWSMGGMIAQELALLNKEKVGKLVILASTCGGKQSILPSQEVQMAFMTRSKNSLERVEKFFPFLFPDSWRMQNPDFVEKLPRTIEKIPSETLNLQTEAIINWEGVCDKLNTLTVPTLIIVGTEDELTPPGNSLIMMKKIKESQLLQIAGGGHGLMFQYPEKLARILHGFFSSQ
jgi:pimeloyl-ACP methyl ester carboxylesterase